MFRKKSKSPATIQEAQQQFNQIVFEIGDLNYRKHMIKQELTRLDAELNTRQQKADALGKSAALLRDKAQEEVISTMKKGKSDEEAPQAD